MYKRKIRVVELFVKMPEKFRYFCMGNALVVPLVERMGKGNTKLFRGKLSGILLISVIELLKFFPGRTKINEQICRI
jgi:hypothetical protein